MEGIPIITFAEKRTMLPNRVLRANSERQIPPSMPAGTARRVATSVMTAVPRMALSIPPPGTPNGLVGSVRKSTESDCKPLRRMVHRIHSRKNAAISVLRAERNVIVRLRIFRRNRLRRFRMSIIIRLPRFSGSGSARAGRRSEWQM